MLDPKARLTGKIKEWRVNIPLFAHDVLRMELDEQQASILQCLVKDDARVSVKSGHGTGKTTSFMVAIYWFLLTRKRCKIGCTAPTSAQLKDVLWSALHQGKAQMSPYWASQFDINEDHVYRVGAKKTAFATARTSSKHRPEALQGLHDENMMILADEASGVYDEVFETIEGALTTHNARFMMASNPTRPTGYFYKSFQSGEWDNFTLSSIDCPRVKREWIAQKEREYGVHSDFYRVRVLGNFPKSAFNQLIGTDLAEMAFKQKYQPGAFDYAANIIGVDPARFGDDQAVIWHRQGLAAKVIWTSYSCSGTELGDVVDGYQKMYNADYVFIDEGGCGASAVDRTRYLNTPNIIPVNFGSIAMDITHFKNRRMEMWDYMRQWLVNGGMIKEDDTKQDVIDDLTAARFCYGNLDSVVKILESKEDTKSELGRSPDYGDGLAVTFYNGLTPPCKNSGHTSSRVTEAKQNYDWMAN